MEILKNPRVEPKDGRSHVSTDPTLPVCPDGVNM